MTDTDPQPMTQEEAKASFLGLVRQYGLRWGPQVPRHAYELMNRCNAVLTTTDKREALGLPVRR